MVNALVTGAKGFLGSALVGKLETLTKVHVIEFNRDHSKLSLLLLLNKPMLYFT